MQLGPHVITPYRPEMPILTLAPMAGVGNWVFRLICARLGARVVGVEFINCRTIAEHSRRADRLLNFCDAQIYGQTGISLLAAQIYGNDLDLIAEGAREFERRGAQVVDINFGCSVPQILRKGCGAAYLRDLDRLYRAVRQTVEAVQVPVIVKTRIGWDPDSINILEVVRRVEDAGAKAIAIHARTVVQKYQGRADWDWITRAREKAVIPVLGNGDVLCYQDALRMQAQTGCQAVMVGRAAMANPWIFAGRRGASLRERIDLAVEQVRLMGQYKGERTGVLETRKHLALYFKGLPRTSELRLRILQAEGLGELVEVLEEWAQSLSADEEADLTLSAAEAGALGWGSTG
jgi:tRNA-dihydrouridine synthase B